MNNFNKNLALWIVIVLMMILLYNIFNQQQTGQAKMNYTEFLSMVDNGEIARAVIQGQELKVTDDEGNQFQVYAPRDNDLISSLRNRGLTIQARPDQETT